MIGGTQGPTGISDTFTGTNGTDLDARELSSGGGVTWSVYRGGAEIQSNAAHFNDLSGSGGNVMGADASFADCTVEVSLGFNGKTADGLGGFTPSGFAGLYVRSKSTDGSGIEFYLNGTDQKIEAFTNDGAGGRTAIPGAEVAFAFATETTYALKAVLLGTSLKFYVDGVLKCDVTSSFNQTATRHGLWVWNTATDTAMPGFEVYGDDRHTFDNFSVVP